MATTNVPPNPSSISQPPPPVPTPCCCPACLGLKCLERPRFFSGQLLTEADFNTEQDYILAKNRLQNRYLHGPGVVCGLQVVCNDCDGWVTVQPGYAIDPCGNDIIVCEPAALNVIEAINECCGARRRQRKSGCDPLAPPKDDPCGQSVQNWCITIEYQERESRGMMPLRNQSCSCGGAAGCNCGGSGKHANGKDKTSYKAKNGTCGCTPPKTKPQQPSQCEPTRILETFKLCVVEESAACSSATRATQGTLLGSLQECASTLQQFYLQFSPQVRAILLTIIDGGVPVTTQAELLDACCRMRQALIDLIADNDFSVHCQLKADIPNCTATTGNFPGPLAAIQQMNKVLEQLLLDCICRAIMPTCGSNPCDDRLILACVTVKNGRIVDICNFACRTYAGSFPALYYWLSAFPIVNQIVAQIRRLCCDLNIADRVDPNSNLRNAARSAGYAAPRAFAANLNAVLDRFSLESVGNLAGPGALSLPALVGLPVSQVEATLKQSNIAVVERAVETPNDVPAPSSPTANLFASPGQTVVLYRAGEMVAGFGPYDSAQELADVRAEVADLRNQIESFRTQK